MLDHLFLALVLGGQPAVAAERQSEHALLPSARDLPKRLFERDVKPKANLVSLFSTEDYPREASHRLEQGTVAVVLLIDRDGRVTDCLIESSSGFPLLDSQTCRILWTRARFEPGRDSKGNPVESAYRQRIRWELPTPKTADVSEYFARHIITVDPEESVVACRFEASDNSGKAKGEEICPDLIESIREFVSTAPEWVPFAGRELVLELQHRVGEPQGSLEMGERPGEYSLSVHRLKLTIDAAGAITSCEKESWGAARTRRSPIDCDVARRRQYEGLPTEEKNRGDRRFTIAAAMYLRPPPSVPAPDTEEK